MTYYKDIRLDYHGGQTTYVLDDSQFKFSAINDFLKNIKSFCSRPISDDNTLLISRNGDVWINDPNKMSTSKLVRNKLVPDIRCVTDLANITDIESVLRSEEYNTNWGDGPINETLEIYGITDAKPEFFGIEIGFIASNGFAMATSIATITGPGAETFFNVKSILS